MSKREPGLDLLRCLALLGVVTFHSFLYNGFYFEPQMGFAMLAADCFRWLSVSCVGIFLMLSGYLKCEKGIRDCWRSILPALIGYLIASVVSIPARHFLLGDVQTLETWLKRLVGFRAVYYGWYVEMYVGLMLLAPFVNRLLEGNEIPLLAGTLILVTAMPRDWMSDYWRDMYPLTYYVLGGAVKKLQPKIKPWVAITGAAVIACGLGLATWLSTDGDISDAFIQEFPDFWIVAMVACLFVGLYRVRAWRGFALAAEGCYGGYLLSHLLDAKGYTLVPQWREPGAYWLGFFFITIPIFLLSILGGKLIWRAAKWLSGKFPV